MMKRIFLILIMTACIHGQDTLRVLWLGNSLIVSSYSRTNEVNQFCQARGIPVFNQYGNYQYNLIQGWESVPQNRDLIRNARWDYVVLEVFSNIGIELSFSDGVPADTNYFATMRLWDALIDSVGAQTVFYLPWGYQSYKPAWDSLTQGWKPDHMDTAMMALKTICTELDAAMFPVGMANFEVQKRDPSMRLWLDGTHGSAQGCYLGGLVCFAELTGQDPRGLPNLYGLDSQSVFLLQQIAWQTVYRPDMVGFGGLWTRPATVDGLSFYPEGGITSLEQYLSIQLLGDLHYTDGSAETGTRQLLYRSLTPEVLSVDHFGRALARVPGTAFVEARSANSLDTLALTVVPSTAVFDSVRITPRTFTSFVTDGFDFTATGYAFQQGQPVRADFTGLVEWVPGDTSVFTVVNGKLIKHSARGGAQWLAVNMGGLTDTVRFTLLQDLSLLQRINFQDNDTIYHPFWKPDFGAAYSDSAGYGWVNTPYVRPWIEKDNIIYDGKLFLTNTAAWPTKRPLNYNDTLVEGTYKIACNDGDYMIRMCLGHPYYHGRVSYVVCGPNITKVNPDGSDTLFKFAPGATYLDPLFGIKTDTVRVRGEQGLFLTLYGPIMYLIVATSDGVDMDSIAFDQQPLPAFTGLSDAADLEARPALEMIACPNPFNPETRIKVNRAVSGKLRIFSISGRQVAELNPLVFGNTKTEFRWNASRLPSGIYTAEIRGAGKRLSRKLILLR